MADFTVHFYEEAPAGARQKYAVIIAKHEGKLLWCRDKDRDTWEVPGGHIEPGETEKSAALREVLEETGAQIRLLPGFRHEAPSPRPGDQRMVIGFAAAYVGGDLRPQDGETDEVIWLPPEEAAARMRFPCDASFILAAWIHASNCLPHK